MKYTTFVIGLQEVPGEVSLVISISNCPMRCLYCHTPNLREDIGTPLTVDSLRLLLDTYRSPHSGAFLFSCVCFLGGDQHSHQLIDLLSFCKHEGLKTCLYTGHTSVSDEIRNHLDFLKVGPYIDELGALNKPTTNQRLYKLPENLDITNLFWSN